MHYINEYSSTHYPIQCKILFDNCAGQQVLGSFVKLVSETLLPEVYSLIVMRVVVFQGESFVGIKICNSILVKLQLGVFPEAQKYQRYQNTKKRNGSWSVQQTGSHF